MMNDCNVVRETARRYAIASGGVGLCDLGGGCGGGLGDEEAVDFGGEEDGGGKDPFAEDAGLCPHAVAKGDDQARQSREQEGGCAGESSRLPRMSGSRRKPKALSICGQWLGLTMLKRFS